MSILLLDLSDELLSDIFSRAHPDETPEPEYPYHGPCIAFYSNHYSLALTCKRISRIIRPLLYKSIIFHKVRGRIRDGRSFDDSIDMHRLVRTLCEFPDLRKFIRQLSVVPCSPSARWETPVQDEGLIHQMLTQVLGGGELRQIIMDSLKYRCEAAYTAILLLLAPRAETVSLDWFNLDPGMSYHAGPNRTQRIVAMAFRELKTMQAGAIETIENVGMQNLKSCSLDEVTPKTLVRVMAIPSLRVVKASFLSPVPRIWYPDTPQVAPGSSGVKSISIADTVIQPLWMKTILASCVSLESFTYEVLDGRGRYPHREERIDPASIREALEPHQYSLTSLRIVDSTQCGQVFNSSGGSFGVQTPSGGALGSLADFPALAHLEIDEQCLLGCTNEAPWETGYIVPRPDYFPPGLKTLKYHTYAKVDDLSEILLGLSVLQNQQLEELTISCPVEDGRKHAELGGLNAEYSNYLYALGCMADHGQETFVNFRRGTQLWSGGMLLDRLDIHFRNIQARTYPTLEDSADMLWDYGIWDVIEYHAALPLVWEDGQTVFGDALMDVFENPHVDDIGEAEINEA